MLKSIKDKTLNFKNKKYFFCYAGTEKIEIFKTMVFWKNIFTAILSRLNIFSVDFSRRNKYALTFFLFYLLSFALIFTIYSEYGFEFSLKNRILGWISWWKSLRNSPWIKKECEYTQAFFITKNFIWINDIHDPLDLRLSEIICFGKYWKYSTFYFSVIENFLLLFFKRRMIMIFINFNSI